MERTTPERSESLREYDVGAPSRATSGHGQDEWIRRHGYEIYARPKGKEPLWRCLRTRDIFAESVVVREIKEQIKAAAEVLRRKGR